MILEKIKKQIAKEINKALGKDLVQASDFMYPPNSDMGDLSLPLFKIAKKLEQSPSDVGQKLVSELNSEKLKLSSITLVGPYLNFKLEKENLAKEVLKEIEKQKDKYGERKNKKKERVMIEYTNANTHKQYHVGHVRNLCFGDSVAKCLAANGDKVFGVSYINDFGIHTAKALWALEEFYKNAEIPKDKGAFLGEVYVRASLEMKESKTAKGMVEGIMKKIESRQGKEYKKWQETRQWTIDQFDKIYEKMGIKLEHIFYENEFIDEGREIVKKLLKKEILRESQGAIIVDLEKYGLGVQVVLRSDKTATYIVADLSLAKEKFKKYKLDKSIYITDNRQNLHFKQLFKVLELMGYRQKLVHLGHDFVKLPSGMIASRTGNVMTFEELYKALSDKIKTETKERHDNWSVNQVDTVAHKLTIGTIKFEMLKVGADQVITFDIKKALSFQGYTAAYLQYTYARINSIIKKSKLKIKSEKIDYSKLIETEEHELILKMAKYPETIRRAGTYYNPAEIAKYLFELAQIFNDYYHKFSILKAEEETKLARLALIININQVIKNGLKLLSIETLEEM